MKSISIIAFDLKVMNRCFVGHPIDFVPKKRLILVVQFHQDEMGILFNVRTSLIDIPFDLYDRPICQTLILRSDQLRS